MAKGSSVFAASMRGEEVAGEYRRFVALRPIEVESRLLAMQPKLHHWAMATSGRRIRRHEHMESRMR